MPAFKREYGTAVITDPDAPTLEMNTITCCHCQNVVHIGMPGQTDLGGWCALCSKCTCGPCTGKPCVPFEMRLLREEGKRAFYRGVEWIGD